jgi:hypothetical protein
VTQGGLVVPRADDVGRRSGGRSGEVGIGSLLHRMLPSVDLGTDILVGVVSAGFSIHYFIRLPWFSEFLELPRYEDDESPPFRVYPLGSLRSGRKRKRKGTWSAAAPCRAQPRRSLAFAMASSSRSHFSHLRIHRGLPLLVILLVPRLEPREEINKMVLER